MGQIYGYLCGTPKDRCCGSIGNYSASLDKKGIKKHGTRQEAFHCYAKHLVAAGYEKLSNRTFKGPEGILCLSKVARFGAELRAGKSGETGQGKSRGMPKVRHGGVIIST